MMSAETTRFELLPNEILLKCFDYLNAPDLFQSFERLNSRFEKLIHHLLLRANFQHVKKSTFDHFCRKLLLNLHIKSQISSLKLSNESDTCCQIQAFLTLFSFEQFPQLRCLTLINVKQDEVKQLQLALPSLSHLQYVSLTCSEDVKCSSLTSSLISTCRTLFLPALLAADLSSIPQPISVVRLTLSSSALCPIVNELFKYMPMLEYLNVKRLTDDASQLYETKALRLKELVLDVHEVDFDRLELLLTQTPKLEAMVLVNRSSDREWIDARRWEQLIASRVPHLTVFRFALTTSHWISRQIHEEFQHFQTDFWRKEHRWFTFCDVGQEIESISTIPLVSQTYRFLTDANRYGERSFDYVRHLELQLVALRNELQYHFADVESLILFNAYISYELFCDNRTDIQSLARLVNLSNLTHLDTVMISRTEASAVLLQIIDEAPRLSSLKIDASALILVVNDVDLHRNLSRMIRKLDVVKYNQHLIISSHVIAKVCDVFSNVEHLRFPVQRADDLFLFLKSLGKLASMIVHCRFYPFDPTRWLAETAKTLNKSFLFDSIQDDDNVFHPELHIWIGENVT